IDLSLYSARYFSSGVGGDVSPDRLIRSRAHSPSISYCHSEHNERKSSASLYRLGARYHCCGRQSVKVHAGYSHARSARRSLETTTGLFGAVGERRTIHGKECPCGTLPILGQAYGLRSSTLSVQRS